MIAFQQFRLWARRAPVAERAAALGGAALAVAAIAWMLPASQDGTNVTGGGGRAAQLSSGPGAALEAPSEDSGTSGDAGGTAGTAASVASGAGSGSGAAAGAASGDAAVTTAGSDARVASSSGAAGCVSPPGSDQGVTASQIKLAVVLVEIVGPAGNTTFGFPQPSTQRAWVETVVSHLNSTGGVACRRLVPVFFIANPADATNLQQTCLDVIQSKPFIVMDLGAYNGRQQLATCYPRANIGYVGPGAVPVRVQKQFYPYLFGTLLLEDLYRDMVFGLDQRGFFSASNGFTKLGVVYRDCVPQLHKDVMGWLNEAGVPPSQIVSYSMGCPSAFANPSDIQGAILTFRQQGVDSVTFVNATHDFNNFTTVAQQQGFTPRYGIADEGIVAASYGRQHPDYDNITNAVAITKYRYGEERTPGYPPHAGTQKCNAIFTKADHPPVYQQEYGQGGIICSLLWFVKAGIDHAPTLARSSVAAGIRAARSVDFSYPYGPNDFSAPETTTAGQFWRVDQFLASCQCWQVVDREWHPTFS